MSIQSMLEKLVAKDIEGATDEFISVMNEKALEALEVKRQEVGAGMFGESMYGDAKKEQEDEDDEDKDDSDDDKDNDSEDDKDSDDTVKTKKDGKKVTITVDEALSKYSIDELEQFMKSVENLEEGTVKSNNLQAGQHYYMHEGPFKEHVVFNGWKKYGDGGGEFKHIKEIPGVKSIKDIEHKSSSKDYGYALYAHFTAMKNGKPDYDFHAYAHKGRLAVGSRAKHVSFSHHELNENTKLNEGEQRDNLIKSAKDNLAAAKKYRTGEKPENNDIYDVGNDKKFSNSMYHASFKNAQMARKMAAVVKENEEIELDEADFQHTEFSGKTGKYWKSPGEVSGTRKVKGAGYGNQYDTDEDGNETSNTPKAEPVKRGRGRPKKDTVTGGSSAFNSDAIAALLKSKMGNLPKGKSRKVVAKEMNENLEYKFTHEDKGFITNNPRGYKVIPKIVKDMAKDGKVKALHVPTGKIYKVDSDGNLKEDIESLDEISGATLGSYIQKARAQDAAKRQHGKDLDNDPKVQAANAKIKDYYDRREYDKQGRNKHQKSIDTQRNRIDARKKQLDPNYPASVVPKRSKGISKAIDKLHYGKLTNEDVELEESKMSELHATISDHMDKHIANYKKMGGAEALMGYADTAAKNVAKIHNIAADHAKKFVSDYIDSKLNEESAFEHMHSTLGKHLDKHIDTYNKMGGAEALIGHVNNTIEKVKKTHGLSHADAKEAVNSYVDSKLNEETESSLLEFMSSAARLKSLEKQLEQSGYEKTHSYMAGKYSTQHWKHPKTGDRKAIRWGKIIDMNESLLGAAALVGGLAIGSRINDILKGKEPKEGDKKLVDKIKSIPAKYRAKKQNESVDPLAKYRPKSFIELKKTGGNEYQLHKMSDGHHAIVDGETGEVLHKNTPDIIKTKWDNLGKSVKEDISISESDKGYRPGWMLKADPELGKKIADIRKKYKARIKAYGNPSAGVSVKFDKDGNPIKEEVELGEAMKPFSDDYLNKLHSEYSKIKSIDPSSPTYTKMVDMLNGLPQSHLKQLHAAGIPWLGKLARNRIKEDVELEESADILKVNMSHMKKWKVDSDNIKFFDNIHKSKGIISTLDTRPYEDHLNNFGIFYTKTKG